MKRLPSARNRVRVTSANIWESIRLLNQRSISVFGIQQEDDLTFSFEVGRKDFLPLKQLLERRGDRVVLFQRTTLHTIQQSILHRPVLYSGLLFFFALSLFLPTKILAIQVEGNNSVPVRRILEAADEAGISLFSPCARVRSEKIKNSLLSAIPELQWAGVNTYGSRVVISVRERSASSQSARDDQTVGSIVAQRDGIIQSITALRGSIQCREGQAVKKGQVLISGFTDCGICIRAERADGEVYAQTLRTLQAVTPNLCQAKVQQQRQQRRYAIILGKKRINLWKDSGIWDSTRGRISREYRLKLPGGFSLPVALSCDTLEWYSAQEEAVDEEAAESGLSSFSQNYLSTQMIAGVITRSNEVTQEAPGIYLLSGQYVCSEMIGRERLENGALDEQND